ncbi:Chloramphenicol acetyltransferase-like domain protein [Niveomyces insectorum RCEF 264]|uniref:Chloramphenicol acetyltransferase-like domain protein n=1 Tax=Niveomyces insectorum RCEF 264 TaxID=1081102 RepID=A0A167UWA9_9HYPO|nr:Chloramphenicol acetyltransferase-like domain protein [Niveomyces insectorum RCEF 264]
MAFWRRHGASPPLPSTESDDIYPVHMLDDTKTLRGIVVTWTLRFNDVLDANKLHASLARLLEIGDWKKLGGRLRLKDNDELEIHVPRPFTADRPAVFYTHQTLPVDIEDDPLAKTLPKATAAPSIQAGPQGFRAFAARDGAPETLEDFTGKDVPQLSLHITSFNDATLVALSWPHTLMDVMGQQALLRGWSLVLASREADVPPMLGAHEDAICAAVDDAPAEKEEAFELGQKRLRGWSMLKFGVRFGLDLLWNRTVETRTIFLPKAAVAALRRQAQDDLTVPEGSTEKPFVSEGDVLTAWALRAVASALPQPRPVTVLHALNARFRLASILRAPGVYVQNMAVAAFTFLSAETARGPLGPIALANRRHLLEQATEKQVLAFLRELQRESKAGSDPGASVCGEADALLMPFTNWTKAGLFAAADFSPALVRAGETAASRSNPPGTMVFHHAQSMRQGPEVRNVVVVLGKDHGDNYWLTGILLPAAWAKIEEDIRRMQ